MEIFPGFTTSGKKNVADVLDRLAFPSDLGGKRVLEIAPWNGFFSFECVRRGAREVVALGPDDPAKTGFLRSMNLLEIENIKYIRDSVYNLPSLQLGTFDCVLFLGIIYHLRHPLLALDYIYDVCDELVFVDSPIIDTGDLLLLPDDEKASLKEKWASLQKLPLVYFSQVEEKLRRDKFNWSMPNFRALCDWVTTSGFEIEKTFSAPTWAYVRGRKTERPFVPALEGFNPMVASMPQPRPSQLGATPKAV